MHAQLSTLPDSDVSRHHQSMYLSPYNAPTMVLCVQRIALSKEAQDEFIAAQPDRQYVKPTHKLSEDAIREHHLGFCYKSLFISKSLKLRWHLDQEGIHGVVVGLAQIPPLNMRMIRWLEPPTLFMELNNPSTFVPISILTPHLFSLTVHNTSSLPQNVSVEIVPSLTCDLDLTTRFQPSSSCNLTTTQHLSQFLAWTGSFQSLDHTIAPSTSVHHSINIIFYVVGSYYVSFHFFDPESKQSYEKQTIKVTTI